MNDVWANLVLDIQQPLTRAVHVIPWIVHPLQSIVTLVHAKVANTERLHPLLPARVGTHRCELNSEAMGGQSPGKLERVGPDASQCIGGHQDARRRALRHESRLQMQTV